MNALIVGLLHTQTEMDVLDYW